jgi:hypothetical protein
MARHKVITTNDEIDQALENAKKQGEATLVTAVEYRSSPELDMLVLRLSDGRRHLIARENVEGLQGATTEQIAHVEILGGGTGLHWPELDLDLYVPALLQNVYGTRQWMAALGRRGGIAKSAAKRKSSQVNGRKGGRPRRVPADV